MTDIGLVHVIIISFLITNIDNLVVLLAFSALPAFKRSVVILGYVMAMVVVVALVLGSAFFAAKIVPLQYVRDLGFIPIAMGIYNLAQKKTKDEKIQPGAKETSLLDQLLLNFSSQLACSIDAVGVFLPLVLRQHDTGDLIFATVFSVMVALLSVVVLVFGHFLNVKWITKMSACLIPWILIAVGVYVLYL